MAHKPAADELALDPSTYWDFGELDEVKDSPVVVGKTVQISS